MSLWILVAATLINPSPNPLPKPVLPESKHSQSKGPLSRFSQNRFYLILLGVWLLILAHDAYKYINRTESVPYSQFVTDLAAGKVESLTVGAQSIQGTLKQAPTGAKKDFFVERIEDPGLVERLSKATVRYQAVHENTFWKDILSWIVPVLLMAALWLFFIRRMGGIAQRGVMGIGKSKAKVYAEEGVPTRFTDVAGIDEARQELQELVQFLKDPTQYSRLGGRVQKGILLVGPPGTGKTLAARAVAGESGVPFFSINGPEFVELFVGLGAARVRDLFAEARSKAPCIVFIDELDALGKARGISALSGGGSDEKEQTLNQLLAEIDGFDPTKGIVLLAATNRPEVLDPALLRSGRFDKQIVIDKPDRAGRQAILDVHLKKIKAAPAVRSSDIAGLTTGFSGADLANLINESALIATRRGAAAVEPLDFTQAIERMIAGLERKTLKLSPDDKRRVATHEMGHAVVAMALGKDESVQKVSIIPRGLGALGYTMRMPLEDRYLLTKDELEQKLAILLAGRASEGIFLKGISTGAADDLDKATQLARAMVTQYGMSEELGLCTYDKASAPYLSAQIGVPLGLGPQYNEATSQEIDRELKSFLEKAFNQAQKTIQQHSEIVLAGVAILLKQETLTSDELKSLWAQHDLGVGGRVGEASQPPNKLKPLIAL